MTQSSAGAIAAGEIMHHGVINVPPQTSLIEVAAQMADSRVHSVVVEGLARGRDEQDALVWGIVSDTDLMKALAAGRIGASAGEVAATEIVTVDTAATIDELARLMTEHDCAHLVVVSAQSGEPVGVVSSLDVAEALARSQESV